MANHIDATIIMGVFYSKLCNGSGFGLIWSVTSKISSFTSDMLIIFFNLIGSRYVPITQQSTEFKLKQ